MKTTYADMSRAVDEFIADSVGVYDNHAYAAGYLGSVLASALLNMSKKQREDVLDDLQRGRNRLAQVQELVG